MAKKLLGIVVAVALLIGGCAVQIGGDFTASIDGETWRALLLACWEEPSVLEIVTGLITAASVNKVISIGIIGGFDETTYTIGSLENFAVLSDLETGLDFQCEDGSLTITSKGERLVGQFECTFVTTDGDGGSTVVTVELTDGRFDLGSCSQ
jgi:hypothetical protein